LALFSLADSTALVFSCPLIPSVGIDGDPWMKRKHIKIDHILMDSRGHICVFKYLTYKTGGCDIDSCSWVQIEKKSAIRKQGKEKYDTGNLSLSDLLEGNAVSSGL
jgi:hypothetical protein